MVQASSPSPPNPSNETAQDNNHDQQTIPISHGKKVQFSDDLLEKTKLTTTVRKASNLPSTDTKMKDPVQDTDDPDDSSIISTSSSATEPIVPDIEDSKNGWTQVPEKKTKS